jgi:predicted DNA-binding protein
MENSENGRKMGRPTTEKKDKRFEIRLSEDTYKTLEECSKKLGVTKAEVIHRGIALVKNEIE